MNTVVIMHDIKQEANMIEAIAASIQRVAHKPEESSLHAQAIDIQKITRTIKELQGDEFILARAKAVQIALMAGNLCVMAPSVEKKELFYAPSMEMQRLAKNIVNLASKVIGE